MRFSNHNFSGGAASSSAAHKAVQHRHANGKTSAHRYERRKFRELLRHGGIADIREAAENL